MSALEGKPSQELSDGLKAKQADMDLQNDKTLAEIKKLQAETKKLVRFPWPELLPALPAIVAILGFALAFRQFQSNQQSDQNRQQAEEFHQDELFSSAVTQLGSHESKQRASAVAALADYALRSTKYNNHALTLIALELQTETDPAVLQVSIEALAPLGAPALNILVQNNRQVQDRLARAIGRYLGIQSVLHPIRILGETREIKEMEPDVYWFRESLTGQVESPAERDWEPWQDLFLSDASFFQRWDIARHPAYRTAFQEISRGRKAVPKDETDAKHEFQASLHGLWVNTQAVVGMLKALSGKLNGANLRGTILLRPHLAQLDLRGIDARSAVWMAPVFTATNLSFADLSGAEMKYADLRNTNLTGADVAQVNFGKQNREIENRTSTDIRFQRDVTLSGTNLWEMADCYLRDQRFDPAKLAELRKQRTEILARPEAQEYLSKIPRIVVDN